MKAGTTKGPCGHVCAVPKRSPCGLIGHRSSIELIVTAEDAARRARCLADGVRFAAAVARAGPRRAERAALVVGEPVEHAAIPRDIAERPAAEEVIRGGVGLEATRKAVAAVAAGNRD